MVTYRITHTTEYHYEESIGLCQNIARLVPRSFNGQLCRESQIKIDPTPNVYREYTDFFGNRVAYYAIEQEHKKLQVTVSSVVSIQPPAWAKQEHPATSWEEVKLLLAANTPENLDARQYTPETAMTVITPEVVEYAQPSFTTGRPLFEAVYHLMQRIFADFEFKAGITNVATPVKEVLKIRKGVCQDFAHLAITCVRAMGLPARYISGYIETIQKPGTEKLVGVDASHAWFSVYIPGMGWVDFDPTNNQVPSNQHITIGWGRDYEDIAPLKGIILTSRPHRLHVSVDVARIKNILPQPFMG